MEDSTIVALAGIICSTAISMAALWRGIDTALIGAVMGIIGSIAGYAYGKTR